MIQWKQIEEAPDYWINNRGEILSKRIAGKEKMIKIITNPYTGYKQIGLMVTPKGVKPPKKLTASPHLLVANYFLDNPNGYNRVNHKDLDKTNNHYWNLEWVSQEQNIHHYYQSDAKNKPRNMKRVEVWTKGGEYVGTYPSINKAAKETNTTPASVWRQCKKGGAKKPRTYLFRYEE